MKLTVIAQALSVAATRLGIDASVRVDSLEASAQTNPIGADVSVPSTIAVVSASAMRLAYELGYFIVRLKPKDQAVVLSQTLLSFFKGHTDNAQLADQLAWDLHKALTDEAGLSDVHALAFFKGLVDTASVQDAAALGLGKPLADHAGVLETQVRSFGKTLTDVAGFSDVEVLAFYKALADGYAVSDVMQANLGKGVTDVGSATDAAAVGLVKVLIDRVYVTDDFDGLASIEDDQVLQVEKQITDLGSVSDLLVMVVSFVRSLEDSVGLSDAAALDTGKPLEHGFLVAEVSELATGKVAAEALLLSDAATLTATKDFADAAGLNDEAHSELGKFLSDAGALGDSLIVLDSTKALEELPTVEDTLAKIFSQGNIPNEFTVTDLASIGPGLVKTESASITDTGSLRSQGYCDFSYFAEDYVGASRTF